MLQHTWIWFFLHLFCFVKEGESTNHSCTVLHLHWHQLHQLPFVQIFHNFVDHQNLWPSLNIWTSHYSIFCCCKTDGLSSFHGYIRSLYSPAIWSFIPAIDSISQNCRLFPLRLLGKLIYSEDIKDEMTKYTQPAKGLWMPSFREIVVICIPAKSPQANYSSHSLISAPPLFWVASHKD